MVCNPIPPLSYSKEIEPVGPCRFLSTVNVAVLGSEAGDRDTPTTIGEIREQVAWFELTEEAV